MIKMLATGLTLSIVLFTTSVLGSTCPCQNDNGLITCQGKTIAKFPEDFLNKCPNFNTEEARGLDLHGQLLQEIPSNAFENFPQLLSLSLAFNDIKTLYKDSFSGLGELKSLFLSYNQITSVPEGTFDNLVSLTDLDLRNNQVDSYTTK